VYLKVLIVGVSKVGGGSERVTAYKNFLLSKNHIVHLIQFPGESYSERLWDNYRRVFARLKGHEKRYMTQIADKLETKIKKEAYDVVIGVESPWSYVLTRELRCLKIFSCESMETDELYFSNKTVDMDRVRCLKEMEVEIMKKSDCVVFPWGTTENYVRRYVWNGNNFVTLKYGCYPKNKLVSYFFPFSVVSLGDLWGHWTNKELLSQLTRMSPYNIDVYGRYRPPKRYHLNYRGFAPTTDVLYNYQFGLNTVTKDPFRRGHFSSRPLGYLAYGLPVFSPDWMQLSHELRGCVPYNEDNFVDLIDKYSEKDDWEKLSKDAIDQARELDWKKTLEPLDGIINESK
jgi:hypothetical protein